MQFLSDTQKKLKVWYQFNEGCYTMELEEYPFLAKSIH